MGTNELKKTVVVIDGLQVFVSFYATDDVAHGIHEYYFHKVDNTKVALSQGVDLDAPEDYVDLIQEETVEDALLASDSSKWENWD
jgi:hypothetical protein